MENQRNNNRKSKGNFQPKPKASSSRPKKTYVRKNPIQGMAEPTQQKRRPRRVVIERDVEVVVVSNTIGNFYYSNPRMTQSIDLSHIGDEDYMTVGDLRTMMNTGRKNLEGFNILLTEVLDPRYTLEDLLIYLGLDKKYEDFFNMTGGDTANVEDIKAFLVNTSARDFEKFMKTCDPKLRAKIIESAVTLFKLKEFGDYNKMQVIRGYVSEDLFEDAESTEVDDEIYI